MAGMSLTFDEIFVWSPEPTFSPSQTSSYSTIGIFEAILYRKIKYHSKQIDTPRSAKQMLTGLSPYQNLAAHWRYIQSALRVGNST